MDTEVLKDIPGYKTILKTVIKSQILFLLEQLSSNTGEESIVLTASVDDGSISHLGSRAGKGFLEGREDMKSQFLGHCLKTHHQLSQESSVTTPSRPGAIRHMSAARNSRYSPMSRTYTNSVPHKSFSPFEDAALKLSHSLNTGGHLNNFTSISDRVQLENNIEYGNPENSYGSEDCEPRNVSPKSDDTDTQYSQSISGASVKREPPDHEDCYEVHERESSSIKTGDSYREVANSSQQLVDFSSSNLSGQNSMLLQLQNHSPGRSKHTCVMCQHEFRTKQNLQKHLLIHTGQRPFKCPQCDKSFRQKHHVEGHILRYHLQSVV
ncbi:zinc finger and SCAN domain-containing protein 12-like [Dreissena polymorpha]|uniref:C2H2-type domain-containing protein n=1 Tax=Dreissena polymorpha TaxID=45954 RepID=A0A9D4GPT8_DREPO|nr:zinc finger and SCAN domain-containing protein 12-like [Dreissena polymorpha]KAH3821139.1 hypothetical protein DPMN_122899 [Dreissena polymorpha]